MPADSLGGAVNMISKNAFERDRAELRYRLYLSAKYKFDLAFPLALKAGAAMRKQTRDTRRYDESWNFVGRL